MNRVFTKEEIERIKSMSAIMDKEIIAQALGTTPEVINSVLLGQFKAEEKEEKPVIIERVKFIRNKIITAISPTGGAGKTTILTSLAIIVALNAPQKQPVIFLDFADIPIGDFYLGCDVSNAEIPSAAYWSDENMEGLYNHPEISNLFYLPAVLHQDGWKRVDNIYQIITNCQRKFAAVFIDSTDKAILEIADTILLVTTDELVTCEALKRMSLAHQEKLLPVINKYNGNLKLVQNALGLKIEATLPTSDAQPLIEHQEYNEGISMLASLLFPDWITKKEKKKGFLEKILT